MARSKKRSGGNEGVSTPISSMIDIVFLLIIFFVVTAAIDKEVEDERINLARAPHGKPVVKKDPNSVIINVHKDGMLTIGMIPVSMSQISDILRETFTNTGGNITIVIRGDKDVQHGYIRKVMDAVTETGLYKIKFVTILDEG